MSQSTVTQYLADRKLLWMKNKSKSSLSDQEIIALQQECDDIFSLSNWLPNAAKRAGQISLSTHPCTFSHPSARKNKNGYATAVLFQASPEPDGFLRTGNVVTDIDAFGNAAAIDVFKFLTLVMDDGKQLIEHIKAQTPLAKSVLSVPTATFDELREGFLR